MCPVSLERGGLADGPSRLQRDFLKEGGGQVAPVVADIPSERNEDATLSANRWAVIGVLLALCGFGRDPSVAPPYNCNQYISLFVVEVENRFERNCLKMSLQTRNNEM